MQKGLALAALAGFAIINIGCNPVSFDTANQASKVDGADVVIPTEPANDTVEASINHNRTVETLKTIQPTLAVRGMACLVCHADIRSNVVTDFGYGNSWYMGGTADFEGQGWYNNYVDTWQTATKISGTVYVPDAPVTKAAMKVIGDENATPIKVVDYMQTAYKMTRNWDGRTNDTAPMVEKIEAPAGGQKVAAMSQIVIRAPSEAELLALAPDLTEVGFKRIGGKAAADFEIVDGGTAKYVMNKQAGVLDCENSDVGIRGSLFLRGLQVNAAKGCRLYVTGSVFIEDAITYVGAGEKQNLQITSARGIFMGMSFGRIEARIKTDARGLQIGGPVPYDTLVENVLKDARNVGSLKDAQDNYNPRKTIDFSSILLNAPIIHSRYLGNVKGTIIAEAAIFAIGAFHFQFDPIFTEVTVLPKLTSEILVTK